MNKPEKDCLEELIRQIQEQRKKECRDSAVAFAQSQAYWERISKMSKEELIEEIERKREKNE